MTADTDFANQAAQTDEHTAQFGEGLGDAEAERQLGQEPLPRFDRYVLKSEGGKGGVTQTAGAPVASCGIRVLEGPEGTVGRVFFADLYPKVNKLKTITEGGVKRQEPRTPEEYQKACDEQNMTLKKIARVFGFIKPFPVSFDADAMQDYAIQFGGENGDGVTFVGAISIRKATAEWDARNFLPWRSIALPTDPAKDKKGNVVVGKTALDDAREEIVKYDQKQAKKGAGRTAGSFAGPKSVDPRDALRG